MTLTHTISGAIVVIVGFYLIGLAATAFFRPRVAARFLNAFASSARAHYTEQALRLTAGAALIAYAPSMTASAVVSGFGWIVVATTVALLLVPWRWHYRFARWAVPFATRNLKLFALGSLALGFAILYGVFHPQFAQQSTEHHMTDDEFWQVIEVAGTGARGIELRPEALRAVLDGMEPVAIAEFAEAYHDQIDRAYTWDLWGAAYVIKGGCSDDSFDYFRDWLISEGRQTFERALADPESLADLPQLEEPELEEFRYIAEEVYEEKTGKKREWQPRTRRSTPSGEQWEENTVDQLYPNLAVLYW